MKKLADVLMIIVAFVPLAVLWVALRVMQRASSARLDIP
jgi:hypothetical protein